MSVVGDVLIPGLPNPVADTQQIFRTLLSAMSEPGTQPALPALTQVPDGLNSASWQLALTLLDMDTRVWLSPLLGADVSVTSNLRFHCQCPLVAESDAADFALTLVSELPELAACNRGSTANPHSSTTLIVLLNQLDDSRGLELQGPGIPGSRYLYAPELPADFVAKRMAASGEFPQGVDLILCAGNKLVALPRTTRLSKENAACM